MAAVLYLVATPIGNPEDITLRAVRALQEADLLVCEEQKEGMRLLRHLGIDKPVELLNEHNEAAATPAILQQLIDGKSVALFSDAGTPVFSDPGRLLVERAARRNIRVVPIPGASSLLPALTASGFPINRFVFHGFLSPKRNRRIVELQQLRSETRTVVLMDTPYRLLALLRDIGDVLGDRRRMCVAFDLTLPSEEIVHGTARELLLHFSRSERKGEFVVVLEGTGGTEGRPQGRF